MRLILIFLLFLISYVTLGQSNSPTYLLIKIQNFSDVNKKRAFFAIMPDWAGKNASEIYSLKKYNNVKGVENNEACFYNSKTDTCFNLYNYFLSVTEALNFMSEKGWTVVSVYTEVNSGWDWGGMGGERVPMTSVNSKPVFVLKKTD